MAKGRAGWWVGIVTMATLLGGTAGPAVAQSETSGTRAVRWAKIGAVSGGALGGLMLGVLAEGLCESSCDNAFVGGFTYGAVGGGVLGGALGLTLGAAVPATDALPTTAPVEGEAGSSSAAGWGLEFTVAPRWSSEQTEIGREGVSTTVRAMRPTTSRVAWGFEVGHHGSAEWVYTQFAPNPDGTNQTIEHHAARRLWSAAMIATRAMGSDRRGYLLASAGVYPRRDARTTVSTGTGVVPSWSSSSIDPFPGIGVGGGGRWRVRPWVSVGAEARLHAIVGPGIWTIGSLGLSVRF